MAGRVDILKGKYLTMEIYKDIEGYEGIYQVSNLGNVKSLNYNRTSKEKILKPLNGKDGYLFVILSKQGKRKTHLVHRIVAQTFIDNPNNLPQINHKDEDKTNNCINNLEFCDCQYNINYGTRNQRAADSLSKQVLCLETGEIYASTHQVQRQLGFNHTCISQCCNGRCKQAYGFHWKYVS